MRLCYKTRVPILLLYLSNKHFIDEYPESPPVHCSRVGDVRQNLRSEKLRCTTERAGSSAVPHILLAQTKVGNLDKTLSVQQKVIQLQISTKSKRHKLKYYATLCLEIGYTCRQCPFHEGTAAPVLRTPCRSCIINRNDNFETRMTFLNIELLAQLFTKLWAP